LTPIFNLSHPNLDKIHEIMHKASVLSGHKTSFPFLPS